MTASRDARSVLATVVGWIIVALVAYFVLRMFVGTIFWLIRTVVVVVVIGGLVALYLSLKSPPD